MSFAAIIGASLSEPHIDEVVEKKVLYVCNSVMENSHSILVDY